MAVNFKSQVKEIPPKESLVKIDISRLQIGKPLPFDVYIKEGGTEKKIFNEGIIISKLFLEVLEEKGLNQIYIASSDEKKIKDYLSKKPTSESVLDSPTVFNNYSFFKEKHFQIDRKLIIPWTEINFSIYKLEGFNFDKVIEATSDHPVLISENSIPSTGELVIEEKDIPLYKEYIESLEKRIENLPQEEKKELKNLLLKENSKVIIKDILHDPRSGEKIKKVENLVSELVENIIEDPESIYSLLTLKGYDYYTYTHSVNVGVLSTGLALFIGVDKEKTCKLGLGAILHDIGKTQIPHEIVNKQGKLTDTEYNVIKQHVVRGYEILKAQKEVPEASLIAVLQHHEKLSGRGYPFGIKGKDIQPFGRITAIADCYDALTTRRPYKPPLTPYFALSIIVKEKGDYDPELLKAFVKMLGKVK
jgi:putative nucleotidyltransferase with HDIG domain